MTIPIFNITNANKDDINNQIMEDEKFSIELSQGEWDLYIDGSADCTHHYEEETNSSWTDVDGIEFDSIVLYHNGEEVEITDDFEKNIMNQINNNRQ